MHNVEQLITEWRKAMMTAPNVGHETLDELENHLRENVNQLVRGGMTEADAFQRAITQLGTGPAIASEFRKLNQSTWLPVKVVTGFGVSEALLLIFLLASRDNFRSDFLLATHVFTVTLGYTTTFLVGALGICFVGQRCVSELSPLRMRSLTRVTFALGCVAAGLTAIGVVLAMIWAKAEWGRYWAWDAKETGAFCVMIWQACFLVVHRFGSGAARGVFAMSVLGNIVVSLGWFGANLLSNGLHSYGTRNLAPLLLGAVVFNLAFFVIALAPAGWLRLRKA
jgi:cytochrome c assembly protein